MVQGTVADILNYVTNELLDREQSDSWKVLYPVHDSIIVIAKRDCSEEVAALMKNATEHYGIALETKHKVKQSTCTENRMDETAPTCTENRIPIYQIPAPVTQPSVSAGAGSCRLRGIDQSSETMSARILARAKRNQTQRGVNHEHYVTDKQKSITGRQGEFEAVASGANETD